MGGVLQLVKMKNWVGRTYADAGDSLGVFSLWRVKTKVITALCRKSVVT